MSREEAGANPVTDTLDSILPLLLPLGSMPELLSSHLVLQVAAYLSFPAID